MAVPLVVSGYYKQLSLGPSLQIQSYLHSYLLSFGTYMETTHHPKGGWIVLHAFTRLLVELPKQCVDKVGALGKRVARNPRATNGSPELRGRPCLKTCSESASSSF